MDFPYFIIISGPPASGKTTLGWQLKNHYNLPFIYKDLIKESLFDTLGIADSEWSGKLGYSSVVLLYKLLDEILSAKKSLIFESAFLGYKESGNTKNIIEKYHAKPIEIHCNASSEIIIERFKKREKSSERHKGHHRSNVIQDLEERLLHGVYGSLSLDNNVVQWQTDDFAKLSLSDLITKIDTIQKDSNLGNPNFLIFKNKDIDNKVKCLNDD